MLGLMLNYNEIPECNAQYILNIDSPGNETEKYLAMSIT